MYLKHDEMAIGSCIHIFLASYLMFDRVAYLSILLIVEIHNSILVGEVMLDND